MILKGEKLDAEPTVMFIKQFVKTGIISAVVLIINQSIHQNRGSPRIAETRFAETRSYGGLLVPDELVFYLICQTVELQTQNSELQTQNSDFQTQNSELQTQNSDFQTQNSDFQIQNSDFQTQNSEFVNSEF